MSQDKTTALVPIAEALPELRAEQYAKVREWDAARMALAGEYEAADGEYLSKIRDALKPRRGMWEAYLAARGIPARTARRHIQQAEGRYVRIKTATVAVLPAPTPPPPPSMPEPPQETIIIPRDELHRLEHAARQWEQQQLAPAYEPVATWPTMYVGLDEPEEEEEDTDDAPTPLAASFPAYTPPTVDADPAPTPQEIAKGIAHYRAQTKEAHALRFLDILIRMYAHHQVTDDDITAWLEVTPRDQWQSALDKLARFRAFCDHAERMITEHTRPGLRAVK